MPRRTDGAQDRTEAAPMLALDSRRLRALYVDLVGRPPLPSERSEWLGKGTHALLAELAGSREFWDHWLDEQLYYFLLVDNFRPAGESLESIRAGLAGGTLAAMDAVHRIALTPSFELRNPGADTFVTVVMEQLAGMSVQRAQRELAIGKAAYDGGKGLFLGEPAASQADVVRIAARGEEAVRHFVAREHERVVGSPLERREVAAAARALRKEPMSYPELIRSWLASPAYTARLAAGRPLSNRHFVQALFVDLLGRVPNETEAETLRTALDGLGDSRPLRAVVVRMLLDSGKAPLPDKGAVDEPREWIREQFLRLLGREPAADELEAFVAAFREPACRPSTVLQVLLSDPAYHLY